MKLSSLSATTTVKVRHSVLLLCPWQQLQGVVMSMSVCVSYVCLCVCLSVEISPEPYVGFLPNFLCMLPMSMAQSSSGTLTTGCIAYRWEGSDGTSRVSFSKYFVHVAHVRGSVLLQYVDDRPHRLLAGRG